MNSRRLLLQIFGIATLTGCAAASTAPVPVVVPGMPSPELALQKSLDRIDGFLSSLNERIETPARRDVPLSITHDRPVQIAPAPVAAGTLSSGASPGRAATPLFGHGIVWFAFGDGYAPIQCPPRSICVVRLQKGETMEADALGIEPGSGWHADVIRGTRGIHAGWAVAVTPSPDARSSVLRFSTNRRSYVLALEPTGPAMRTVAFTYSPSDPQTQPNPTATRLPAEASPTAPPDFAYEVTGPDAPWKPIRVYRDGNHTYFQFPPGEITAAPRLVVIAPSAGGSQNYKTVGDSYVVDLPVDDALLIGSGPSAPTLRITHGVHS